MQFTNKSRKLRTALRLVFGLGLIPILNGCLAFHNETINVTNNSAWWGELHKGEMLQTKQEAFLSLKTKEWIVTGAYGAGETVSIEQYKADPDRYSRWPWLRVLSKGTRMRCVKLERFYTFETSEYRVYAEVLMEISKVKLFLFPRSEIPAQRKL